MDDYKQYLAQKILTEDQLVTYRLLSRALRIHVNTAKEMLYEFHKWQNDKHPNSLHATYLVYGTKKNVVKVEEHDGDVEMTDSQNSEEVHPPFSDDVPTHTLSLVKEEQLQDVLAEYDEVRSIHVYSLAPHPLKDLQLLADTARQVLELSTTGDVPVSSKAFGSIANPNVHKRERRVPVSRPGPSAAPKQEVKPVDVKEEPKVVPQASVKGPSAAAAKKSNAASLKRQGSSGGIGQMFAKAAAKPKKPTAKTTGSGTSSAAAKAAEEDEKMAMSDDGEDDAEPMPEAKDESSSARRSRKDRQAELRRMMEESEEEEEPEKPESPTEEPMEEEPEPEPEPKTEEPAEIVSSASGGRRRGRRRVMRKKQVMDDKGYLVTIQEQGWESFSEEEKAPPPPPKQKPQPTKAESNTKSKKAAGKGQGQGNIMSFFAKK
ncbi:DNA polymerase subunit Cdc27 [Jackrogersella minutella]|nr:DNA polymerase subunit Cdc27 [Jackrogersella minutella]